MRQDHRGGIEHEGPFDHLAGIDLRGIDGAAEHLLATDDTMAVIKEQAQEGPAGRSGRAACWMSPRSWKG